MRILDDSFDESDAPGTPTTLRKSPRLPTSSEESDDLNLTFIDPDTTDDQMDLSDFSDFSDEPLNLTASRLRNLKKVDYTIDPESETTQDSDYEFSSYSPGYIYLLIKPEHVTMRYFTDYVIKISSDVSGWKTRYGPGCILFRLKRCDDVILTREKLCKELCIREGTILTRGRTYFANNLFETLELFDEIIPGKNICVCNLNLYPIV